MLAIQIINTAKSFPARERSDLQDLQAYTGYAGAIQFLNTVVAIQITNTVKVFAPRERSGLQDLQAHTGYAGVCLPSR